MTCALIALAALTAQARTFVLCAGVSNYNGAASNLSQTSKDAKRFKELMLTQTNDITLLTSRYATRANILEKLRAICNRAQNGDRIIFFFSGHGSPGAMCAYDGHLSYSDVANLFAGSDASEKYAFVDVCFAGTAMNDVGTGQNGLAASDGQVFMLSSSASETSSEDPYMGAGMFTQALLKGLRGKADSNENRQVTVQELHNYIYNEVVQKTDNRQHPVLIAPQNMKQLVITKW